MDHSAYSKSSVNTAAISSLTMAIASPDLSPEVELTEYILLDIPHRHQSGTALALESQRAKGLSIKLQRLNPPQ